MPFFAGAAILGGSQLLGGLFSSRGQRKEARARRRLQARAMGVYEEFLRDPRYDPFRGEQMYRNAIGSVQEGFQDARRNLAMAGTTARRTLQTGAAQTGARMQQSMQSRGLYGTTALDNAQRGISGDLARSLASVDESVGQMMAGLATQRGMATAGAQQALGQFYGNAVSQRQNQMESYINLMRDAPPRHSGSAAFGNALTQFGGQMAGLYGAALAGGHFKSGVPGPTTPGKIDLP